MKEASFYESLEAKKVRCLLCRHNCVISEGKRGICTVRENRGGKLYSLVYGIPCSWHIDPIEKKPLFHFYPGSRAFSIATVGCNFQCLHCQNYEISQMPGEQHHVPGEEMAPEEVVEKAVSFGCKSISYTYTEPTIFFEYAFDIAKLAKEKGLFNTFVTNGYTETEPLRAIKPYLDAANIDLKGFTDNFYRTVCKAELKKVLETIKVYKELGIWIEITTLIIPGYNDSEEELNNIARFIVNELGPATPWHVSAFYPTYRLLDVPRTPVTTLMKAREIGIDKGLRYVYTGNAPGGEAESTFCHNCGKCVIDRYAYNILEYHIKNGACEYCNAVIDGMGM